MVFHWKVAPLFLLILYSHADFTRAQVPETTTEYPTSAGAFCTETDYSPWSKWSTCSVTCGQGSRSRSRDCNGAVVEESEKCTMISCAKNTGPRQVFECSTGIEVSFLIDTSGSVGIDNFKKVQQFTKDVTTELKTGYERLNITIITFNNEAKISLSMNESSKLQDLLTAEGNLTYTHGGTETHKALQLLYQSVIRNDTTSPQVAIVVTDGSSWHTELTKQWAQRLKNLGIVIYVVGVGDDFNPYELRAISSDPDEKYFFRLNNYDELSSLIGVFSHKQCPVSTTMSATTTAPETSTLTTAITEPPTTEPATILVTDSTTSTVEPTTVTQLPTTTPPRTTQSTLPTTTPPRTTQSILPTTTPPRTTQSTLPTTTPPRTTQSILPTTTPPRTTQSTLPTTTPPRTTQSTTKETQTTFSITAEQTTVMETTEIPISDTKFPTTTVTPLPNETPSQTTGATKAPLSVPALTPTGRPATAQTDVPTPKPSLATLGSSETRAPPTVLSTDTSTMSTPVTSEPVTPPRTTTRPLILSALTSKVTESPTTILSTTTQTPVSESASTHQEITTTTKTTARTPEETTIMPTESSTASATTTTTTTTTTTVIPTKSELTESVTESESTTTRPQTTTELVKTTMRTQLPETMIVTKQTTTTVLPETTSQRERATSSQTPKTLPVSTTTIKIQESTHTKTTISPKQPETTTSDNRVHTSEVLTTVEIPDITTEETTTTTSAPATASRTSKSTVSSTPQYSEPFTIEEVKTTPYVQESTSTLPPHEPSTTTTALPPTDKTFTRQLSSSPTKTTPSPVILTAKRSTSVVPTTPADTTRPETTTTEPHTTVTEEPWETTSTELPSTTTPSCIAKFADVVFVVDSSGSIGRPNFEKIKEFIKNVVLTFDVDYRYTRVGLIEFSTTPSIEFKLNEKTNITDLIDAIDNITYSGGGTSTSDALELMRIEGFDRERPLAPDIAIVITDGLSKFPQLTRVQAQLARAEGIAMFSIGIGNETSTAELQAIASSPRYVFEVGDYQTLFTLDGVVAHRACGVVLPEEYHTRSSTPSTTTRTGCFDIDAQCPSYPRDSCTDFEPFARKNCPRKCGFCPGFPLVEPACEDTITDCHTYGTDMCSSTSQYEWVDAHCRKFCGFCGNKTDSHSTTTTPPVTTVSTVSTVDTCSDLLPNCSKYGGPSMCQAYGDWAKARCAKYCEFCFTYTTVPSVMVNNIVCPQWKLPDVCTLDKSDGKCCPMPKCPDNIVLTVKRH